MNRKIAATVVLVLVAGMVASACLPGQSVESFPVRVKGNGEESPKTAMSAFYTSQNPTPTPRVPSYNLPLDISSATNTLAIQSSFGLSSAQLALLSANGFVTIPWRGGDIVEPYHDLKTMGVPIFVTSDTLLHLYHIQFNEVLRRIEEEEFFASLTDMSKAMMQQSALAYQMFTDPRLKEASRRNVAYFAVALELLQTPTEGSSETAVSTPAPTPIYSVAFQVPDYVRADVAQELKNINEHAGFNASAVFGSYQEDYSQYVPRGHYTRSEALKRYFKAMMWCGRMAFLLKGGPDGLVSQQDADIATMQATLISVQLPLVKVGEGTAEDVWNRIYSVTSFFVGVADDLTPWEYLQTVHQVFGDTFQAANLAQDANLLQLKAALASLRSPQIYGGTGEIAIDPPLTEEKLDEALDATKGMRFMGQRYVPDSYIFQQLVAPAVGPYHGGGGPSSADLAPPAGADQAAPLPFTLKVTGGGALRTFPRGLDVMAVLGSDRAYQIMKQEGDASYQGYDEQLARLKQQFEGFTQADWNRNLYWSWLYALRPLLDSYGPGYPTFMQSAAWQDKELNTALASWTELRHDTILYAKQSYTMIATSMPLPPKPVVGYVEPVPDFYARILALTSMTRQGLEQLKALTGSEEARLSSLEGVLTRLLDISNNELANRELTEDDYEFVRNFGDRVEGIIASVDDKGKETTVVADVHTDTNQPQQVLEEGVGNVDMVLVAYRVPDGRIIIGAGPTLSYYEFKQPLGGRLTDEAWKDMVRQGQTPPRPAWTGSFLAGR